MKKITLLILFASTVLFSQKEKSSKMGQTTLEELKMTVYDKDSTAAAVVLYEHANFYFDTKNNFQKRTDYYYRIKIFKNSAFDLADINIRLFKEKTAIDIEAVTYNLNDDGVIEKNELKEKDIFSLNKNDNYVVKKFTLPNVREGSIIEYKYSLLSPYNSIDDWYFQSEIPKIKSEFDAAILGNYKYNIRFIGYLKLNKDNPSINKNCLEIPMIGRGICAVSSYGMYNIPAFKKEDYMLSDKNYLSRITFDLKSVTNIKGHTRNYTTTWDKADESLKKFFFNNQTSKKNFFKKRIPVNVLNIKDDLERSKKIFYFIQNHFTWNDKNWTNEDVELKEAFKSKIGDVGDINLALYNSLKAVGIDVKLLVLSTRNNGFPTKLYPIIFDYNYVVIKAKINGENYYLDATDKYLPFGQLPFKTLNGEARVLDAEANKQWEILKPRIVSYKNIRAELTLNEESEFVGDFIINKNGYFASNQRRIINSKNEADYLEVFENDNPNIIVEEYNHVDLDSLEKSLKENFKVKISLNNDLSNKTRINPFAFLKSNENPFKLKVRNYPVNFGYPRKDKFSLRLIIPQEYKITQLPKMLHSHYRIMEVGIF